MAYFTIPIDFVGKLLTGGNTSDDHGVMSRTQQPLVRRRHVDYRRVAAWSADAPEAEAGVAARP